jgi:hypothetical protein
VVQLRTKLEGIRSEEEERFLAKLQHLSERDQKLIRQYGNTLVHKILHDPMTQIKKSGEGGAERSAALASSLRYLFKLEESMSPGEAPAKDETPESGPKGDSPGNPTDDTEPKLRRSEG